MNYIDILIYLETQGQKRVPVQVKNEVKVEDFINQVCKRYSMNADAITVYAQINDKKTIIFNPALTFGQNRITSGTVFVFAPKAVQESPTREFLRLNKTIPLESTVFVCLQDETTGKEYRISWQPAVIGRHDNDDPNKNRLLAVDLSTVKDAQFISRQHACIMRNHGQYYVESIHELNPTYLEGVRLVTWQRRPIHPGDRIRVGKTVLIFKLLE